MKVSVLQENLNKGLSIASKVVSSKTNLPILTNILLIAEEGKLKLTATNLETGINVWLPAKKENEGRFTAPAKDLTEFIASLSPGKIELETKQEKLHVVLGKYKAIFNGMAAAEFPSVPSLKDKAFFSQIGKKFFIDTAKFVEAVNQVCFSAAIDETRPVLTGVRLDFSDRQLQLVATDGYRLSLKKIRLEKKINIPILIIPARALMEVVKIIEAEGGEKKEKRLQLAITKEKNQIIFSFNNAEVVARLIEGEFPEFGKIIPKKGENKVLVDKEEFSQAIRAASIFARRGANIIKLKIKNEKLKIMANAPEIGENEIDLSAKCEGKMQAQIAFNYRFLQDFLNNFNKKTFSR